MFTHNNKTRLFENLDPKKDEFIIVKELLNHFGEYPDFSLTVDCLLGKEGTVINEDGCCFPGDLDEYELYNDYNGVPFEGVKCWVYEDEIIVSENDFFKLLKIACERYIELHPNEKDELQKIMAQSTLV